MPTCQNCGSHVTERHVEVFEHPEYADDGPRVCLNCDDKKWDKGEVREKRA